MMMTSRMTLRMCTKVFIRLWLLPPMAIGRGGKLIKPVLQDLQETRALGKRVSGLGHAIIVEVQVTSSKNVPLSQEKKMKGSSLAKTRPKLLKLRTFQEESRRLYMSKKAPLCKLTCPERKKNMKL